MNGQHVSVFDSVLYSPLFTQQQAKHIWSDEQLVASWLEFETAIASVQAELGIIPEEAANDISNACLAFAPDWQRLANDTASVGMAIKPLIDQLSESGNDNVKRYLHWGCTTQDLLDTSLGIRVKRTLDLVREQLVILGQRLVAMATEHKHTVMVARTNAVDASATTWGLMVSSYLAELSRHIERLDQLYPRACVGVYGGAVGNLASVGTQGMEVKRRLFNKLGLFNQVGMNNASLDPIAEVLQFFALIHGSLCRIANDIEMMGRTALSEAFEGEVGGGSSAMPHKTNPRACNTIQTLSRMGWMYASSAPNLMDQQDVRAASMRVLNWTLVPEASLAVSTSLERAERLITNLVVCPDNMLRNFEHSRQLIMSESVMMALSKKLGRHQSYEKIKLIVANMQGNQTLVEALCADNWLSEHLSQHEIESACDPRHYLGCNDELIEETIEYFSSVSNTHL